MKALITALVFCGMASLNAQARVPKALKEAKTAYIVDDGASPGMMDGVAKELLKWGRFGLVDQEALSDITITLGGLKPFGGWPMTITDSKNKAQLWITAQKHGRTNKVSGNLVKKLRKLLQDKKK